MIGAVVVTYNPDQEHLALMLEALRSQVDEVCVVDNTINNRGIAAAQNEGIRSLIAKGCDFILQCDQDSMLPEGMLKSLTDEFTRLEEEGIQVGALGPRAFNSQTGQPYPHQCNRIGDFSDREGNLLTEMTCLMSSGMLTRSRVLQAVGEMEEELFIDGVDSEWCWRGRTKGYRYFVVENQHLWHQLGMGSALIAGRQRSLTPPARIRYQVRNYRRLLHRSYVPLRWKLYNGCKYIMKYFYYLLCSPQRREYAKCFHQGLKEN